MSDTACCVYSRSRNDAPKEGDISKIDDCTVPLPKPAPCASSEAIILKDTGTFAPLGHQQGTWWSSNNGTANTVLHLLIRWDLLFAAVNRRLGSSAMAAPSAKLVDWLLALFVPFLPLERVLVATYPNRPWTNAVLVSGYACCFLGWIGLALASFSHSGLYDMSITLYFMAGAMLTLIRSNVHSSRVVGRNAVAGFLSSAFVWPVVIVHMQIESDVVRVTKMENGEMAEWDV
jgi:hypothetical protein